MKTFLFLAMFLIGSIAAQAQKIVNNTPCPMRVTPACYDKGPCTGGPCGPSVVVPPMSTMPLPVCACPVPLLQGYIVCYGPGTPCQGLCTNVGNVAVPCPAWPVPAVLGPCPACGNIPRVINYNAVGDLVIN